MISIIITSYKEPKTIVKAISCFLNQKIKEKFEIIVICGDKETFNVAKKNFKESNIFIYQDKAKGKSVALNLAFKKARGDILVLSDGDVFVSPDSLKNLRKHFKNKKVGAVCGHPVSIDSRDSMMGFWSHFLTDMADQIRLERVRNNEFIVVSGYLFAMRKDIIDELPESLLSEDAYISHIIWEKGYKISYVTDAIVHIKYPTTIRDWMNQKIRSTGGYIEIRKMVKNKKKMRSFSNETKKVLEPFKYSKNLKEIFYSISLIFFRLILWLTIFYKVGILKKNHKELWVRVESTK
ncbi:glycosyltransferase [Candidatus Pacearchaeota archaeon]|nr:glycosyltransferase [Candidatus Pacearchaeota archaeon]